MDGERTPARRLRIAVVGHVEHVTTGGSRRCRAPARSSTSPRHAGSRGRWRVAFLQLARSDAEVHLFTALGHDEAGDQVAAELAARLHDAGTAGRRELRARVRRAAPTRAASR